MTTFVNSNKFSHLAVKRSYRLGTTKFFKMVVIYLISLSVCKIADIRRFDTQLSSGESKAENQKQLNLK